MATRDKLSCIVARQALILFIAMRQPARFAQLRISIFDLLKPTAMNMRGSASCIPSASPPVCGKETALAHLRHQESNLTNYKFVAGASEATHMGLRQKDAVT